MGYAMARGLAQSGAKVVIHGRSQQRVGDAAEGLGKEVPGADIATVIADLTTSEGAEVIIDAVPRVDVLVHNAGTPEPKPFFDISDQDWQRHFQLHVMAAVRLSRQYAQGMMSRGWGRILLNASTTSGFFPGEMVHYGTTKTALLGLSRGLAESLSGTGVTLNAFLPGPTRERSPRPAGPDPVDSS